MTEQGTPARTQGRRREVLGVFLRLGLTSFGGPTAHFGYFRTEFVTRRRWLNDGVYAELLALMQFLPGPASSQLAVTLGMGRAGLAGGLLAWLGFTLPSAVVMLVFALAVRNLGELSTEGWVRGLQAVVVGVVAQAIWSMGRRLCPDWPRRLIALLGVAIALLVPGPPGQVLVILAGGAIGWRAFRDQQVTAVAPHSSFEPLGRPAAAACLAIAMALLGLLPLLRGLDPSGGIALIDGFYRAGALVFGGGHVVLPLLQAELVPPGFLDQELFLAGYGVAQAVPGPLFSFAAYLGAVASGPWPPLLGALICLIALYLPSMLILIGILPFWARLRRFAGMGGVLTGVGAAVVGLLGAVLIHPVIPSAIRDPADPILALIAFGLLLWGRVPPWLVVIGCAAGGALLTV